MPAGGLALIVSDISRVERSRGVSPAQTDSIAAQFISAIARSVSSGLVDEFAALNWALIGYAAEPVGALDRVLDDMATHQRETDES
jgi:hypothetical protein